jgi:hypothetical protein
MTLKKPVPIPQEYKWNTIPEILYEIPKSPDGKVDPIPFIEVPQNKKMPPVLFIMEYKHTGEKEVGPKGLPEEIMEELPHKYIDFEFLIAQLKNQFDESVIEQVYFSLGMQTRTEAKKLGEEILNKVLGKTEEITKALNDPKLKTERENAIKSLVEKQTKYEKN